ncbi:hypothetical protein B0H14DRAFT_3123585 [Mycena olivaceomarginata]|nr:hypothetical protein B0H14DRAFT_3123585 [Mycena olivaceomarginata]
MVVWVQPTNDTKRRVVAPLLGIAMLTTLFRLTVRVIVALSFLIILLVSMWLRTIPGQTCIYGSAKRSRITARRHQPCPQRSATESQNRYTCVGPVSTGDAEDLDAEVAVEVPADAEAIPEGRTSASAAPTRDMLIFGGTQMTWMRI